ncbi:hypothetical protein CC85DRAFT_286161 [Cutaneotrichosporon oleaginosum]|uniref:Uncharacterized protein n=1 Tax=Cutaneotrichosporon oleaginosum TaxID=879819 RepID=A0A0J1B2C1_9TREE|nr:uncharacterized protein CC85DRAFT_286161 [Cutaneotrichosporon oleaginosum]KLT41759.1 hypothetical protein CC85DRAFT_286161 [Cutaneotrichosporon oleaginosum]TXT12355.1 hypothetical protein COLE_02765 [Cutaneotrichosporon oleaginosum]
MWHDARFFGPMVLIALVAAVIPPRVASVGPLSPPPRRKPCHRILGSLLHSRVGF